MATYVAIAPYDSQQENELSFEEVKNKHCFNEKLISISNSSKKMFVDTGTRSDCVGTG